MKKLLLLFLLLGLAPTLHAKTVVYSGTISGPTLTSSGSASDPLICDFTAANVTSTISVKGISFVQIKGGTFASGVGGACFSFSGQQSHDVTISGWTYTGNNGGTTDFCSVNYCYNLTLSDNRADNIDHLINGDSTQNHDLTILNNFARTSNNQSSQTDVVFLGDAYNVTIQGNQLINRAPGAQQERHNDIIQCYQKGGGNAGNPKNWTVCYNWIEMQQTSGSGDASWTMLENMDGNPAMRVYGNVFVGTGSVGNNGLCVNSCASSAVFYCFNNTFIRHGNPDNTVRFLSPGKLYFRNNVMQANSGIDGTFFNSTMSAGSTWDYNFFYNADPNQSAAGSHGSTTKDPRFTNYAANDFSLSSSSPLIGAGDSSIGAVYNQGIAKGATWPNPKLVTRNPWDVGAYASGGSSSPTPSPTASPTPAPTATPTPKPPTPTPSPSPTATPNPSPTPLPTSWKVGQAIAVVGFPGANPPDTSVSVRSAPGGTVNGSQPVGSKAVLEEGPRTYPPSPEILNGVNTNWWRCNFNNGLDGWIGEVVGEN